MSEEIKLKVYLETSFWSFLNGHPTPLQHIAIKQATTLQWNLAMENNWNYEDPMDEIYAIRRMISERYGHDVRRIAAAARERMKREEAEGSRTYLHLPSARIAPAMA